MNGSAECGIVSMLPDTATAKMPARDKDQMAKALPGIITDQLLMLLLHFLLKME
jgi:hypothetical protein